MCYHVALENNMCILLLILCFNKCAAADVGVGANSPETLKRLLEMEFRSNTKQIHPLAAAGNKQGMYNYEVDMGFRYR